MSLGFCKVVGWTALALLLLFMAGCTAPSTPTLSSAGRIPTAAASPSKAPIVHDTPAAASSLTEAVTLSPTASVVVITANKGNLNIRRGPGISYNPISVLKNGQSATAHGRDFLAHWIMVDVPGKAGKTGWIRTETDYSMITGDIESLPEVVVDFAIPAYVQNCTNHLMVLQPGNIPVSSRRAFPDNTARVYPGEYIVYDDDVQDAPEVMTISVQEGALIDINVDGNSERHKCP